MTEVNLFSQEVQEKESNVGVVAKGDSIKIKKVVLENYRNFVFQEFYFDGLNTLLLGNNGLGKTNVIEAIFWTLNNQLFSGDSKTDRIGITPLNSEEGIKTRVEITFEPLFTFEKIFFEKYNKKTGEYQGTETSYYVNGGLVRNNSQAIATLKEYLGVKKMEDDFATNNKLKSLDVMGLIYNLLYQKVVDYQVLRELIVAIVGEVNYQDVITQYSEKYQRLVEPLTQHNGDVEALYSAKRTEKFGDRNKEGLEDKIKATTNLIANYRKQSEIEIDPTAIENAKLGVETLDKEIAKLEVDKAKSSDEALGDIELKIERKRNEIAKAKSVIQETYSKDLELYAQGQINKDVIEKRKSIQKETDELNAVETERREQQNKLTELHRTIDIKNRELKSLEEQRGDLRIKYGEVKNKSVTKITCPSCNHVFDSPFDQENVKRELDEISKRGNRNKDEREALQEGIETLTYELEQEHKKLETIKVKLETVKVRVETLNKDLVELEKTQSDSVGIKPILDFNVEPILTLENELKTLVATKETAISDISIVKSTLETQINELKLKRDEYQEVVNQESVRNSYLKNAKLESENLKMLNEKLTDVEELLLLIKELQKDMFTLLNEKVENKFGENIKFNLFKINIDGSVDTRVCDMLVKDIHGNFVKINNINSGMFPIRAIEFVSKVKEHYGIKKSFIFVDELFGLLDEKHKKMLYEFGEQVIGTGYQENNKIEIVRS